MSRRSRRFSIFAMLFLSGVYAPAESFNPADGSALTPGTFGLSVYEVYVDGDGNRLAMQADRAGSTDGVIAVLERHRGGENAWYPEAVIEAPAELVENLSSVFFPVGQLRIDGDTLAAAYHFDDEIATNAGAVFIYHRTADPSALWSLARKITPPPGAGGDLFGQNVVLEGDTLAVANTVKDGTGASVFIYGRHHGGDNNWGLVRTLTAPGTNLWPEVDLALDRDTLLIGDYYNAGTVPNSGIVHIHRRDAGGTNNWGMVTNLVAPDGAAFDYFGFAIGLYEDTAVVGAYRAEDGTNTVGKVYVYARNEGGNDAWGWVATLLPDAIVDDMDFGRGVAIHGDTILVAATDDLPNSGAYVFRRNRFGEDAWGQTARLSVTNLPLPSAYGLVNSLHLGPDYMAVPEFNNQRLELFHNRFCPAWNAAAEFGTVAIPAHGRFGSAVALNERYLAVGQPGTGAITGEVLVYARNEGGKDAWGLDKVVTPPSQFSTNARFGAAVALDGDVLAVGAPDAVFAPGSDATGAMAVYLRNPANTILNWASGRSIVPPPGSADGDAFGSAVALERGTLVVGSPGRDGVETDAGSAFVYRHEDAISNVWLFVAELIPSVPRPGGARFGRSVAISRDTIAVASRGAITNASSPASVHLFRRNLGGADAWGEVKVLTGYANAHDFLSAEVVSLDGDVLVVGAPFESEGANANSGAAYVFHRNQGGPDNWGLVARITSPDPALGALFGVSVSVKGDNLVIGENGVSAPGLLVSGAGRAYLYRRNEGGLDAWGLVRELENPSPELNGQFGTAVALGHDGAVVGEPFADYGSTDRGRAYLFTPDCIPVTITDDLVNGGDRENSLREAITSANAKSNGVAAILLPEGNFSIEIAGAGDNANFAGDFDITNTRVRVEIHGAGPFRTAINGARLDRVFQFFNGVTGLLSGITITNGYAPDGADGNAGNIDAGNGFAGGAIRNAGVLEIERCQIMQNDAGDGGDGFSTGDGGDGGSGGGVWNSGSLTVRRSTFYFNRAGDAGFGLPSGSSGNGGAIFSSGELVINNSSIGYSFAGEGGFAAVNDGSGGGIYATGPVTIRHCTFINNFSGTSFSNVTGQGGCIYATQPVSMRFSITDTVNHPDHNDITGTLDTPLYNVISDTTGIIVSPAGTGNQVNVDPQVVQTPADNGGGILTFGLLSLSPAVDAGTTNVSGVVASEDQRGASRTGIAAPLDIGAVELKSDFDEDGIPDAYEIASGSNPEEAADAPLDADFDAFSAYEEYVADTDWQDGADALKIIGLTNNGLGYADIIINRASSNRVYNLEFMLPPYTEWQLEPVTHLGGTNTLLRDVGLFPTGMLWRVTVETP